MKNLLPFILLSVTTLPLSGQRNIDFFFDQQGKDHFLVMQQYDEEEVYTFEEKISIDNLPNSVTGAINRHMRELLDYDGMIILRFLSAQATLLKTNRELFPYVIYFSSHPGIQYISSSRSAQLSKTADWLSGLFTGKKVIHSNAESFIPGQ